MEFLSLSTAAMAGIIVAAVFVFLLIVVVLWYISTKNKLISLRNDMEESYSAMDVQMKKRYDLIPNLVETCKGYAKFESDTLMRVTKARSVAIAASPEQKAEAEKELSSSLRTFLHAVQEQYPDLKANGQFNNLSAQLEQAEEEISRSRKYYNAKVKIVNNKIEKFPSSIVANRMHMERYKYFELDDVSERRTPKVDFGSSNTGL